jgi:hypothetical protein
VVLAWIANSSSASIDDTFTLTCEGLGDECLQPQSQCTSDRTVLVIASPAAERQPAWWGGEGGGEHGLRMCTRAGGMHRRVCVTTCHAPSSKTLAFDWRFGGAQTHAHMFGDLNIPVSKATTVGHAAAMLTTLAECMCLCAGAIVRVRLTRGVPDGYRKVAFNQIVQGKITAAVVRLVAVVLA